MAGRPEAISIVVNAETDAPMTGVDVAIPRGFMLSSVVPAISGSGQHWPATRQGDVVRYRGQGIPDGGVLYIELMGQAGAPGTLPFNTITRAADGTVVSWSGPASSDHPAALVTVTGAARAAASVHARDSSVAGPPTYLVVLALAAALGLAAGYARRRRVATG
jgi:hypothetical protein